ncbi:hypothetical protein CRUP_035157, partial [Coryphaenoides rupestris]
MRAPPPAAQGGKVSEPEQQISFHGVAYVDMGPLLYPGATRIRGAYRVHPFSESDLLAKAQCPVSVLKEQARAAAAQGKPRRASPAGSHKAGPGRGLDGGNKAAKEAMRKLSATGQSKLTVADAVTDAEAQVNAEGQVLDQYQQLFGAAFQPGARPLDPGTQEQRRSQLLGELNYSGKFFAFKEQM